MSLALNMRAGTAAPIMIEGYASLFGVADQMGDVVRQGAFRAALARRADPLPMLLQHEPRLQAGIWREAREDRRGLFVRGEIAVAAPAAAHARRFLARGMDGLSIGFVPVVAHPRGNGRLLEEIDLIEVSLVAHPMQPLARLSWARGALRPN